jgi:hypothetical protein
MKVVGWEKLEKRIDSGRHPEFSGAVSNYVWG